MILYQEIYERHPELLELREFKTDDEIVEAYKDGGTMWEVWSNIGGHGGVSRYPKEVTRIEVYQGKCETLQGKHVFYHHYDFEGKVVFAHGFISDLQNVPAKGVFTTKERAETFLGAVKQAFENDPEWQKFERQREAEMDNMETMLGDDHDDDYGNDEEL
mgnify:CR=1 FL=1